MYKQILVTSIKAEKTFWMIMCCGSVCLGNAGELAGDSQTLTETELRAGGEHSRDSDFLVTDTEFKTSHGGCGV